MKYIDYVNINQGTKSDRRFSRGNTLPLVQMPHGMISFSPQSDGETPWWYNPEANFCEGIRLTHQPSPWIGDYGTLLITPQSDVVNDDYKAAYSGIAPNKNILSPGYMRINFLRSKCTLELTPSERSAVVRVKFDRKDNRCISLFNIMGSGYFEEKGGMIFGYTTGFAQGAPVNFKMYFAVRLRSGSFKKLVIKENGKENSVLHCYLSEKNDEAVFDISISYISFAQAAKNIEETCCLNFDNVRAECENAWENYLKKIKINENETLMKTFYSCLYRTAVYPHKAYEYIEKRPYYYNPYSGAVCEGIRFTGGGFWDTYRTVFPLYAIIDKKMYSLLLESCFNEYSCSGWLPRWIGISEIGCMPSTLIDAVIADAAIKNIVSRDLLKKLFEGMEKHSDMRSESKIFAREGIEDYIRLGYVPCDKYSESVNLTLDFAYGDYCIAVTAGVLGYEAKKEKYLKRAGNYKNIFDNESGFMRARKENGEFKEGFDPLSWGGDYTEASAWQTTFSAVHDFDGLAHLMGGEKKLIEKLDALFAHSPDYRVGGYGTEIHEMTEMMTADFGLCAISNQPSFVLPYIYAYFGYEDKASYWVHRICNEAFSDMTDGFPGDEDNGSMAAWFILGVLGIYPICPGKNEYVFTKPIVKYADICGIKLNDLRKLMHDRREFVGG